MLILRYIRMARNIVNVQRVLTPVFVTFEAYNCIELVSENDAI